ncbi:putative ras-like small GTPase [Leptomonas seymouri]|uniref:Putative ras-like small GTPase n=1 Tax=Leptomonas seymouri TaxID=5684 RepID=A0A0N1PDS1_LEPSE|nr:putative ras-like small GTPase [Leptomonas seymouri]|eukprot:KPI87762.1 putative ras-like small GTPase [Leptomonas seymouri]
MAGDTVLSMNHSACATVHLPEIRVVVLGDSLVGKTSFLRQYLDHEGLSSSVGYEPTILDSYTHIECSGKQSYWVHFTDCSSAPEFREHRAAYLAKCDVVILVFSALHRKTLLSLRNWMEEVMEARTTAGPARFASTIGDFSEVPIFVVGTHYGEKQTPEAQKPVPISEAESVTMDCLHAAGYFMNEEDAEAEEEQRLQRAALEREKKQPKKKRSPRAFLGFFSDHFKSSAAGDADGDQRGKPSKSKASDRAAKKSKREDEAKDHNRSSRSRSASQLYTSCGSTTEKLPGLTETMGEGAPPSEDSPLLALPPGASPRLPLYMLSNDDSEAVDTAVRASLALHLWLKQLDNSDEVSSAMTPPTSPCEQNSALVVADRSGGGGAAGQTRSTPPHRRSVSVVSHDSHMSERSATSYMPSMHALYGSVTSLNAFDTSFYHSRATSSGPVTDASSPVAAGQPTQMLVAVGDSTPLNMSSSCPDGKANTELLQPFLVHAPRAKGSRKGSPWHSPKNVVPGQAEKLDTAVTPKTKRVYVECCPPEVEATQKRVTTVQDEQLVQPTTVVFLSSPPNPLEVTASNKAIQAMMADHPNDLSVSTPYGEYSAFSGKPEGDSSYPLPAWATADTPAPRGGRNAGDYPGCMWKDIDAEGHLTGILNNSGQANPRRSVVMKLSLEHESNGTAAPATTTSQKASVKLTGASLSNKSPRVFTAAPAPISTHHDCSTSFESSIPTPRSPSTSSQSRQPTHTHSRSPSYALTPPSHGASRSKTRPPPREEDDYARVPSLTASSSQPRVLVKSTTRQKQKVRQCTSGNCNVI